MLSKLIKNSGKDTKKLFSLVNTLTGNKSSNKMPEGQSDSMLAKEFATFFLEKLKTYATCSQELMNSNQPSMSRHQHLRISHHSLAMKLKKK